MPLIVHVEQDESAWVDTEPPTHAPVACPKCGRTNGAEPGCYAMDSDHEVCRAYTCSCGETYWARFVTGEIKEI